MCEFKRLFYQGQPTHYIIFEDGYLFNIVNHKGTNGTASNGYCRYLITLDSGKPCSVAEHRALAETFIPNDDPQNKNVVHHIDGNPYNNNLSNLEWVSQKENTQKRVNSKQTIEFEHPLTEQELLKEIWVDFIPGWQVSNMGRRKNLKTGNITLGSINKNTGYVRWNFGIDKETKKQIEYQAHRAVYQAFHPDEEIDIINHIDGCRNNNRLSNLENVSQSQNVLYGLQLRSKKSVAQLDEQGNLIALYPSASEAERQIRDPETHKSIGQISSAIRNHMKAFGYYWQYVLQEDSEEFLKQHPFVSL